MVALVRLWAGTGTCPYRLGFITSAHTMFIGVCTIEMHVPDSGSLKDKRHSLRSLKDRIRNKFNVSVAEIDDNDLWQKASLAVAAVSNDKSHLNQTLDHVLNMVRGVPEIDLLDYHIEIF